MKSQPFVVAGIVAVAILAIVASIGLGWWSSSPAGGQAAGELSVTTSLTPHPIFFGDPLVAEVDVDVNRAAVRTDSVKLAAPSFDPYDETKAPEVSRHQAGPDEVIEYRYSLQCVNDDSCLPLKGPNKVRFRPVTVTAMAGSQQLRQTAKWPLAIAESRLQPSDISSPIAHFRAPATLPAPIYSVAPGALADGLTIGAVLLAAAALLLLGRELVGVLARRRLGALTKLTPLEAALLYLRQAAGRPDPADRRKALELLATVLDADGVPTLAGTAGDVAWAEEPPTPARVVELADEVETVRAERS
jgi:hypothetical protein